MKKRLLLEKKDYAVVKIVFHEADVLLLSYHNEKEAQLLFHYGTTIESFIKAIGEDFYADNKSFTINNIKSDGPYINVNTYKDINLSTGMYNDEFFVSVTYI